MRLFKSEFADAITSVKLHSTNIDGVLDENRDMKSRILKLEAEIAALAQGLFISLVTVGFG